MDKLIDKERERRKAKALWEERWREKNATQAKLLREQKELENKKQSELEEEERFMLEEKRRQEDMELDQIQVTYLYNQIHTSPFA